MRFIILLFSALLITCSEVVDLSNTEEYELKYNYKLLKAYFYKPKEIKEYSEYYGMEIDSMYSSLKDTFKNYRYTRYYAPDIADDVLDGIVNSTKYYSFGFERYLRDDALLENDTLIVSRVYPISPAANVGLKKRDKLLFANDKPLTGSEASRYLNSDSLFDNITSFKVLRGTDTVPLSLPVMQKAEVLTPTVFLDSLENVPYITVTQYKTSSNNPDGTYAEFKEILQEIEGAKTAIMDIRYNPGGNIYHCTAMAAELTSLDDELVYDIEHYYDGRINRIDTVHYFANDFLKSEGAGKNIKWVILINANSASCAERFVAAVKYNRPETAIIGQTTYGKGIGQVYTKTQLGGLAYITSLQTFYPNGATFHLYGVEPNIPLTENENIYRVALEAAQTFAPRILAKSSSFISSEFLPPVHSSETAELGAYKLEPYNPNILNTD